MKNLIKKFISRVILIYPPGPTPIIYIKYKKDILVV